MTCALARHYPIDGVKPKINQQPDLVALSPNEDYCEQSLAAELIYTGVATLDASGSNAGD